MSWLVFVNDNFAKLFSYKVLMCACPDRGSGKREEINTLVSDYNFCVSEKCLSPWLDKWSFVKYISRGYFGAVFQVCNKDTKNCQYVIKIQIKMKDTIGNIDNELHVAKLMSDHRLGPKILDIFSCPGYHKDKNGQWKNDILYCIIMEKMDITYKDWKNSIESLPDIEKKYRIDYVQREISRIYQSMKRLGWIHRDLENGTNIMLNVNSDGRVRDVKFIDFGVVYKIKESEINEFLRETPRPVDMKPHPVIDEIDEDAKTEPLEMD